MSMESFVEIVNCLLRLDFVCCKRIIEKVKLKSGQKLGNKSIIFAIFAILKLAVSLHVN